MVEAIVPGFVVIMELVVMIELMVECWDDDKSIH